MTGRPLAHVVGVDAPGVVLSAAVAAWLLERTNLAAARTRARGEDRAIDEALTMLTVVGLQARADARPTSAATSATTSATSSDAEATTGWVTTEDAAARLGVTPRAVRLAANEGRIPARRQGRRWLVDLDRAAATDQREQRKTA